MPVYTKILVIILTASVNQYLLAQNTIDCEALLKEVGLGPEEAAPIILLLPGTNGVSRPTFRFTNCFGLPPEFIGRQNDYRSNNLTYYGKSKRLAMLWERYHKSANDHDQAIETINEFLSLSKTTNRTDFFGMNIEGIRGIFYGYLGHAWRSNQTGDRKRNLSKSVDAYKQALLILESKPEWKLTADTRGFRQSLTLVSKELNSMD